MASNGVFCDYPLRILIVDVDKKSSNDLKTMLTTRNPNNQVCTTTSAAEALQMLRQHNMHGWIVMSDLNVSDMDAFDFFDRVANQLDVPLIMMSMDGDRRQVMKGIQHGACAYLPKPIEIKDVQYIWQHVYRQSVQQKNKRKIVESSDREGGERMNDYSKKVVEQIDENKEKICPKRILELKEEPSQNEYQIHNQPAVNNINSGYINSGSNMIFDPSFSVDEYEISEMIFVGSDK